MATELPTLGTRIRRARERARLSQEELAKLVGASSRAVGDWENDRRKPRNRLAVLEDVLGVSLADPEPPPSIPKSLRREIMANPDLDDDERRAVIAAVEEAMARERGAGAPSSPRDGSARRRPASLSAGSCLRRAAPATS